MEIKKYPAIKYNQKLWEKEIKPYLLELGLREDDLERNIDYWDINNYLVEVVKWFREKHNLVIAVSPTYYDFDGNIVGLKYIYTIFPITNEEAFRKSIEEDLDIPYKLYNTYEDALNEGIKEALNKI